MIPREFMISEAAICLECWNSGIMECWEISFTHYSSVPSFHHSKVPYFRQCAVGRSICLLQAPFLDFGQVCSSMVFPNFGGNGKIIS
jgi:hypothetical protein